MKTAFIIVLLLISSLLHAQQNDIGIAVKKKQMLTITPDSMYFESHTARKFRINGMPKGGTITGQFNGNNIHVRDSLVTLQPFYVFRDSDVMKYRSGRLMRGEKTTTGDFYITSMTLKITDSKGELIDSIVRTCYIRPETYNRPKSVPLSSATFDPLMKPLLKSERLDSAMIKGKR